MEAERHKTDGDGVGKSNLEEDSDIKLKELRESISSLSGSAAAKELSKLIRSGNGGLLRVVVITHPKLSELLGIWKIHEGKAGMQHILSLTSAILSHPDGKFNSRASSMISICRVLDRIAMSIVREKMEIVYEELSKERGRHRREALLLMASIVTRGSGLACEVAKNFDFKHQAVSKLAANKKRGNIRPSLSTRKAFVRFAMSFLEVGKPGLLRWIIQQKEMYASVLKGLSNEDDDTITYVLSTLRDNVLTEESLVPPGLRSVLFGIVTLEQLAVISARGDGGPTSKLAHNLLVMVCTDPSNGLMPDSKRSPILKGNSKRLLALMKKLKATAIDYHRSLLLSIVKERPSLASAYMEEFPYSLDYFESPNWFSIVSLAANIVSSLNMGFQLDLSHPSCYNPPLFGTEDIQSLVNCILSRSFSRTIITKGLLHSDFLVNNGALKLLFELLKLLGALFQSIDHYCSGKNETQKWLSLKQEIQHDIQISLPDSQVLVSILSSMSRNNGTRVPSLKKRKDDKISPLRLKKRRKISEINLMKEDTDIIVGGLGSDMDATLCGNHENGDNTEKSNELDDEKDFVNSMSDLWKADTCSTSVSTFKDVELFFLSKLLDSLKLYLLTMPTVLEGSFDFCMNFLSNSVDLPSNMLCSLLSFVLEYIGWSPETRTASKIPSQMYKYLHMLINLLIFSPIGDVKVYAYELIRAAMASTGAFDRNPREIDAWFLFLPGCNSCKPSAGVTGIKLLQNFSSVILFLCDAVSTLGNNLFRYWNALQDQLYNLNDLKDDSPPDFSPLIICVLQKSIRLLRAQSGSFSLPEKMMISLYVSSTIKYILQIQINAALLSALIQSVLSEEFHDACSLVDSSLDSLNEWQPLKKLSFFAESILHHHNIFLLSVNQKLKASDDSFSRTLGEVKKLLKNGIVEKSGIAVAFVSSLLSASSSCVLRKFPQVLKISHLLQLPISLFSSILFLHHGFVVDAMNQWPKSFLSGLQFSISDIAAVLPEEKEEEEEEEMTGAVAVSLFLREAAFHVLFPAVMCSGVPDLVELAKMKDLLVAKLSFDCGIKSDYVRNLCLILFWLLHLRSTYEHDPHEKLEQLAEFCCSVVNHMLSQLLGSKENLREVASMLFSHPIAISYLSSSPLKCNEVAEKSFVESFELFHGFSGEKIHKMDNYVLGMLTASLGYFFSSPCSQQLGSRAEGFLNRQLMEVFHRLMKKVSLDFMDKVDLCFKTGDFSMLISPFCVLHAFIDFFSPFQLFKLVHYVLRIVDVSELANQNLGLPCAISVGCCIAGDAYRVLCSYLQKSMAKRSEIYYFWEEIEEKEDEEGKFDFAVCEEIYAGMCKYATTYSLDCVYSCLSKAIAVVQKCTQDFVFHPFSLALSRAIMATPMNVLSHCIYHPNVTNAKFLFLLVEMSQVHLSVFGYLFLGTLDEQEHHLADDEYMMILPSALAYLNSISIKLEAWNDSQFQKLSSFCLQVILKSFQRKNCFISNLLFHESYDFLLISDQIPKLVDRCLLNKVIFMLQHLLAFHLQLGFTERMEVFNFFISSSSSGNLLDSELQFCSAIDALNLINGVMGKIAFCKMMLFLKSTHFLHAAEKNGSSEISATMGCVEDEEDEEDEDLQYKLQFLNILASAWQYLVKNVALITESSEISCFHCFRYLELFILRTIVELTGEMKHVLMKLPSISYLEKLVKSSLLYRFEDPDTLRIVRSILATLLLDGSFSHALYLQLLLSHSQFSSTILPPTEPAVSLAGPVLRPMSSVLRSVVFSHQSSINDTQAMELYLKRLEIVKLLRILLHLELRESSGVCGKNVNLKELYFLLLSSYGATLSELDSEIYSLLQEIESHDKSVCEDVSKIDHLWGAAALKMKESALRCEGTCNSGADAETVEEHHRSLFREHLLIEPRKCAMAILYFPFDRIMNGHFIDNLQGSNETLFAAAGHVQCYDPVFLLRFSVHILSLGYVEPMEFANLGLLAIAFVSLSSFDLAMRKLSYDFIARYKNVLEQHQKKKDVLRIRLLLTYIQNGIHEPWQWIPSILTLFAAESSFILLDSSHDFYAIISKHLMSSSGMNIKCIPLFHAMFYSTTVNFKTERLWMLRLLFAGVNLNKDAQIFIKNAIFEILLSFYSSPLSDNESKELILQTVKKSVKLSKLVFHLVQRCALFPWLSSILSVFAGPQNENESFLMKQLVVIIEIVTHVVSVRSITEWLQKHALDQILELASRLFSLLLDGLCWIRENASLVDSIMQIMISAFTISQGKVYHSHFIVPFVSLCQIFHAFDPCHSALDAPNPEFGLKTLLMCSPPLDLFNLDQEKFMSFFLWAASTAMKSDAVQKPMHLEPHCCPAIISNRLQPDELLLSKLLRWLVALAILRNVTELTKSPMVLPPNTLLSLLEHLEEEKQGARASGSDSQETMLASMILHLYQLLSARCFCPSSVVSALCLLLLPHPSRYSGSNMHLNRSNVLALCSKIRSPTESNPSWKWSFNEPGKDAELDKADLEKMEELHASQSLVLIACSILSKTSVDCQILPDKKDSLSELFIWERTLLAEYLSQKQEGFG